MTAYVVGFTGTRRGMTRAQSERLRVGLERLQRQGFTTFVHGDCIGADAQAHTIALGLGYEVHVYPCDIAGMRAYCSGTVLRPPKSALARNRDIVDASHIMTATPAEAHEVMRSGTWSTIRYARRRDRLTHTILPDGSVRASYET